MRWGGCADGVEVDDDADIIVIVKYSSSINIYIDIEHSKN